MDTGLIYGQYLPIVVLSVVTIMMIEAGGNVDDEFMVKLAGEWLLARSLSKFIQGDK